MSDKQYPHQQPFNIRGTKNKSKKHAWWQHSPFHNNKHSKDKKT